MKSLVSIFIAAILALSVTACGKHEEPRALTADEQRASALANSEKNAKLQDLLEQQRSTALANVEK